jgi:hypothetical protein
LLSCLMSGLSWATSASCCLCMQSQLTSCRGRSLISFRQSRISWDWGCQDYTVSLVSVVRLTLDRQINIRLKEHH